MVGRESGEGGVSGAPARRLTARARLQYKYFPIEQMCTFIFPPTWKSKSHKSIGQQKQTSWKSQKSKNGETCQKVSIVSGGTKR